VKKLLAILLSLCIVLSCVPTVVIAQGTEENIATEPDVETTPVEETAAPVEVEAVEVTEAPALLAEGHDHYACACAITGDASCTHEGQINWQPWNGSKSITNTEADPVYYYLTDHVKLTAGRGLYGNVVLCLNGYSISPDSSKTDNKFLLQVGANNLPANVTIMDCGTQCAGGVCTYKDGSGLLNGNSSNGGGGAIQLGHLNTASSLNLIGVRLSGNTESNGGENYGGGAIHVRNGNATIRYSKFDNNKANGVKNSADVGAGGAISVYLGSVNASNTIFSGNQATAKGGAIFLRPNSNASLRLTDCQFSGQNTAVDGAAVYVGKSCAVTATGTSFSGNVATGYGAVYVETSAGAVSITGGGFTGNEANYGSALYIAGTNNVTVSGTSFIGNTVKKNGTIFVGSAVLKLNDVTINDNAGGLRVNGTAADITLSGDTRIWGNTIENVFLFKNADGTHIKLGALAEDAKVCVSTAADDESLAFVKANAEAGFAAENWSENTKWLMYENIGAYISYSAQESAFYVVQQPTHTHHACVCVVTKDTTCPHSDEPVQWQEWSNPNSLPTANAGNYYLTTNVVLSAKQTIIADINLCLNGHTITPAEDMNDGMIRLDDSKHTVKVTVMDCATSYDSATGTCTYKGGIKGGHSTTGGGTIQVGHQSGAQASDLILIGVELSGNTESYANGSYGGGAIHVRKGNVDMRYCKLDGNKAVGADVGAGGAISVFLGSVSAKNTVFTGNEAVNQGGAIYLRNVENSLELENCSFSGNSAAYGSAVFTQVNNIAAIADTVFTDNTTAKNGTIYVVRGIIALENVTMTNNRGGVCIGNVENTVVSVSGKMQIHDNTEDVYIAKAGAKLYVGQLDKDAKVNITTKTQGIVDPDDFLAVVENVSLADTEATGLTYASQKVIGYEAGEKLFYFVGEQVDTGNHNHCFCGEGTVSACDHKEKNWKAWYSTDSLPVETGSYYLVNDVTMAATALIQKENVDVQLCLNGKTVTAPAQGAVYSVFGQNVELTITDCTAKTKKNAYAGGKITGATSSAIMMRENSVLNLFEGSITGNPTAGGGGAVSLVKVTSTFNMYGGIISNNSAKSGGGVYVAAGATMNLWDGSICENKATDNYGGGIRALGTLNMYGGTISGNIAAQRGGGVYQEGSAGVGLYKAGIITGNKVDETGDQGGGLFVAGGKATLSGVTITNNEVPQTASGAGVVVSALAEVNMTGGEISGHSAKLGGGVCVQGGSKFTISGGEIKDNKVLSDKNGKGGEGGGIYVAKNTVVTVSGGSIKNNTASVKGGGIMAYDGSTITVTGGNVESNIAEKENGGGVYIVNARLDLKGGYILKNETKIGNGAGVSTSGKCQVTLDGTFISENRAAKDAGGMLLAGAGSEFTMISGTVSHNEAGKTGGGIFVSKDVVMDMQGGIVKYNTAKDGAGICVFIGKAELSGGNISYNTASNTGGGVQVTEKSSVTVKSDVVFNNNKAVMGAAVCVTKESKLTMSGGTMEANAASKYGAGVAVQKQSEFVFSGGQIRKNTAESGGGILLNTGAKLTMQGNAALTDNKAAKGYGGGIAAASASDPKVRVTINGGVISGNIAEKTGGGINSTKSIVTMTGGSIRNNTSVETGGGMYVKESVVTLSGGTISGNSTKKTGGGIATGLNTTLNLKGVTISGNLAMEEGGCGGGLVLMGKNTVLNFTAGTVKGNKVAKSGGGVYISRNTTINMSGGTITGNEAGESGGGLILGLCTTNITGGEVSKNISMGTAGGISNSGKCLMNISGMTISENYADRAGGGVVITGRDTELHMSDCVIKNNVSKTNSGAGLYQARYCYMDLKNVEITGNTAGRSGGGLYLAGFQAKLENVTLEGNEAVQNGGGLYLETQSKLYADGIEVHSNTTEKHGGGMYLTTGTSTELRNGNFTGNKAAERGAAIWAVSDLIMHNLKVTGNTSGKLGTVYLADNKFDGWSYMTGFYTMSGDMIITDNPGEGKDLYLSGGSCLSISAPGLSKNTKIGINLKEGLLTDKVYGEYDYKGGNLEYVITYGDRSVTDPEILPVEVEPSEVPETMEEGTEPSVQKEQSKAPVGMLAVAAVALLVGVLLIVLLSKRKKKNV